MKYHLLILVLFTSCASNKPSEKKCYSFQADKEICFFYKGESLLVSSQVFYKGKKDGPGFTYYPNGNVHLSFYHKNDTIDGIWIDYYESGNVKEIRTIVKGLHHGKQETYYESGQLETVEYFVNNLSHGLYTEYHPNGVKSGEVNYVDGKKEGPYNVYSLEGKLVEKGVYKNDSLISVEQFK